MISPFIENIKLETSSYGYLESIGCLSIDRMMTRGLPDLIAGSYGSVFTDGFTMAELQECFDDGNSIQHVKPLLVPNSDTYIERIVARDSDVVWSVGSSSGTASTVTHRFRTTIPSNLAKEIENLDIKSHEREKLNLLLKNKDWPALQIHSFLIENSVAYKLLFEIWDAIPLRQVQLTSVGIAIGHAGVAKANPEFNAKLSVWIK